jgi:hypothetical protein
MPTLPTSKRLIAFLEWLDHNSDPQELCSPPGIGGLWRTRFIRSGLDRGVIVVHHSGELLAFSIPKSHGICPECARERRGTLCTHCNCAMCAWEHEAEERNSLRVSQQKLTELALRMRAFAIGSQPPAPPASLVD